MKTVRVWYVNGDTSVHTGIVYREHGSTTYLTIDGSERVVIRLSNVTRYTIEGS